MSFKDGDHGMLTTLLRLRLKQAVGDLGSKAVFRFLAPNVLIGICMAISMVNGPDSGFKFRLGSVACGVALFILVAETRRIFFSGGDIEHFYFVQPTKISRLASILAVFALDVAVILSVFVPSLIMVIPVSGSLTGVVLACIVAVCASSACYLLVVFAVASLPEQAADISLTILQVFMVLVLLAVFQLPLGTGPVNGSLVLTFSCLLFLASWAIFLLLPIQEHLIPKLNRHDLGTRLDFVSLVERMKRFMLIRSKEEEAGSIFFLSNLLRNSSLRLSTIGIAATPIMVAIYWSMKGVRFLNFDAVSMLFPAESVAPISSLIASGILVHYFLSQNLLSSKDHEAKWMLSEFMFANHAHDGSGVGKFMLGFRKSFLLTVHVPMSVLVFCVIFAKESFLSAFVSALTFYLLTHVAASWFFTFQKRLPFTLPFTQIGSVDFLGMLSMFVYSFLAIIVLYFCYGSLQSIIAMDFIAFVLIGVLEMFSVKLVNHRVKFV